MLSKHFGAQAVGKKFNEPRYENTFSVMTLSRFITLTIYLLLLSLFITLSVCLSVIALVCLLVWVAYRITYVLFVMLVMRRLRAYWITAGKLPLSVSS
jgi:hypothetical protein